MQIVHIVNKVNNAAIRRERNGRGDLIYIVPSYTLPDNIIMNSGLYPAAEIASSYHTLEGTKAPFGHPYNNDGDYISADDAEAIDYFYVGAVNKNVRRIPDEQYGHRVYVEKHINHAVAMQTERGRRLIEAIDAGEPVHTSTGVLVEPLEQSGEINGKQYSWVATGMVYDHDAILLDEEGAATPDDGVGMLVNHKLLREVSRNGQTLMVNTVAIKTGNPKTNQSMRDKEQKVRAAISGLMPDKEYKWLEDWGEDYAIIEVDEGSFRVSYTATESGEIEISGDPEPVRRVTTWEAIQNAAKRLFNREKSQNQPEEGDDMALPKRVEAALKKAEINIDDMSDDEKMNAYDKLLKGNAAQQEPAGEQPKPAEGGEVVPNEKLQEMVSNAVSEALKANKAEQETAERTALAEKLKANKVELSEDDQKSMSINALRAFVEKTEPRPVSIGLAGGMNVNHDEFGETKMPNVEVSNG